MRRGAELLAFILFVLGGCEDKSPSHLALRIDFQVTGSEEVTSFEVECAPPGGTVPDPARVCAELAENTDLFLPVPGLVCPLPVGLVYVTVEGTYGGRSVRQTMRPCSEPEDRAIAAWSDLLGYEPPPRDRR
jgi:subtilisin inhibitor-like